MVLRIVSEVPPTSAPGVPENAIPEPAAIEEVAALYIEPVSEAAWRPEVTPVRVSAGVVNVPLRAIEVVPVPPIARVLAEKSVEVAPPKKRTKVVVELPVAAKG
jgi:hypothetical protein